MSQKTDKPIACVKQVLAQVPGETHLCGKDAQFNVTYANGTSVSMCSQHAAQEAEHGAVVTDLRPKT